VDSEGLALAFDERDLDLDLGSLEFRGLFGNYLRVDFGLDYKNDCKS
jgi:hypothetical protein